MVHDRDALEEQAERLKNAVKALTAFSRSPQERLDIALSYFVRTFRGRPDGEAGELYAAIYAAIGDPPVGTTLDVRHAALRPEELEIVSRSLVELFSHVVRRCVEVEHLSTAAPSLLVHEPIPEGTLGTLVPSRSGNR